MWFERKQLIENDHSIKNKTNKSVHKILENHNLCFNVTHDFNCAN